MNGPTLNDGIQLYNLAQQEQAERSAAAEEYRLANNLMAGGKRPLRGPIGDLLIMLGNWMKGPASQDPSEPGWWDDSAPHQSRV